MVAEVLDITSARTRAKAWKAAASVLDPEVPVLNIEELGILREITVSNDGLATAKLTPTYSGCPAVLAMGKY